MPRTLRPGTYIQTATSLDLMGFNFLVEIEVRVTDWGQGPTGLSGPPEFSDPGWGPEFEIEEIILHLDEPRKFGPAFVATGALFEVLAKHFEDDIDQAIAEFSPDDEPWDFDEDYYRGDR